MATECRLFITDGSEHWQILTFAQKRADASIYISAPDFTDIRWLVASPISRTLHIAESPADGKLSLHGSGITHVRAHTGAVEPGLRFPGNALRGPATLGVRHLLTVFPSQPSHAPASPAFRRKTDQAIKAETLAPYVLVFWAVPSTEPIHVTVTAAFQVEDLESVPPASGFGALPLALHNVVWFAYRTKHMQRWPKEPHACFNDGFHVPLLIGTAEGECRIELRSPTYRLNGNHLSIET